MIELRSILCPTDFSENADYALNYAIELAKKFGSTIHVHHAISIPHMTVAYDLGPDVAEVRKVAEENAKKKLDEVVARVEGQSVEARAHLTLGAPFVDIINLARDENADLIVLGKRGISSVDQMLMGATAEKVVRKSPCDVLAIRHPDHEFVLP